MPRKYTDGQFIEAFYSSRSIAEILTKLGLQPVGGNYRTAKRLMVKLGLDPDELPGQGWSARVKVGPKKDISEYLKFGVHCKSDNLRRRLISEGFKEARCEGCTLDTWLGSPIPLELDHIDGDHDNNLIENLRILCPNCHAQTETYRGKNIGRGGGMADTGILKVSEQ